MSDSDIFNRFARLRQRIGQLRRYTKYEPNEAGAVVQQVLEDIQRALDELRVIEEELRLLNDELVMARKTSEQQRRRYRQLFDFIPDAYVVTDMAGRIREANPAAALLLRAPRESLLGKSLVSFVVEQQKQGFTEQLERLGQLLKVEGREVDLQPAGEHVPVHASVTAAVVRDESDRKVALQWMIREMG